MEKYISSFNIEEFIPKGENIRQIKCKNCNTLNIIKTVNKLRLSKINTVICKKCKKPIKIGDIYNFRTGEKLHDLLNNHDQNVYDLNIWKNDYDNI